MLLSFYYDQIRSKTYIAEVLKRALVNTKSTWSPKANMMIPLIVFLYNCPATLVAVKVIAMK